MFRLHCIVSTASHLVESLYHNRNAQTGQTSFQRLWRQTHLQVAQDARNLYKNRYVSSCFDKHSFEMLLKDLLYNVWTRIYSPNVWFI